MKPKSLSASSAQVFETCEARYRAESLDRTPQPNNTAAALGTACHGVLERWVKGGFHVQGASFEIMRELFDDEYVKEFADRTRYNEGLGLLEKWHANQDWTDREVLSTEVKKNFPLKWPDGEVFPFNYIMDRVDRHADGSIEVVDYKTVALPITADALKHKLQARVYAVAAQVEHPEADGIWVTFDLLRYEPVSVYFPKAENEITYRYLKGLVRRIFESDGTTESLNAECRFCVRKHACSALTRNIDAGGVLGIDDPSAAVETRLMLENQRAGVVAAINELDAFLLSWCREHDETEIETDSVKMRVKVRGTRTIDSQRAASVVGAEVMSRFAKVGVKDIDGLLKGDELDDAQKSALKQLVTKTYSEPSIETKVKAGTE